MLDFWTNGSSDSPCRFICATLCVVGSQVIPYHLLQQLVPVQDLNMPKCGSCKAALKASNAALSDGGQAITGIVVVNDMDAMINHMMVHIFIEIV